MKLKRIGYLLFKGIVILIAAGVMVVVALYLFRGQLIAPHIERLLERSIESQLSMDVAIGNIGGSYLTNFEVTNVTTLKPASAGVLVSLELSRLTVSYNLLSFLRGLNAFLGDVAVVLESARLELDLSRKGGGPPTPRQTDATGVVFLPELLPRIRIEDTSVVLRGSGYETAFKGIALESRPRRLMTDTIGLRVSEWSWRHPAFQTGKTAVSAEIEYTPEKIAVKQLMLGKSELVEILQIGLKSLPERMPFKANLHAAGGQLVLDGELGPSELFGQIEADRLNLAQIASIFQPVPALEGTISLTGEITLPLEQPHDFVSILDLQLNQGIIYGFAAEKLNLQAATNDGKMRVDKLDLQTGKNLVELRNVSSSSQAVFGADVEGILQNLAGGFSFDCRDIPALISLAGVDLSSQIDTMPAHRLLLKGKAGGGDIIISGGSLTTDQGHIRLDPSRLTMPSLNRPIKDIAIQAAMDIDLPDLEQIGRLFKIHQLGGAVQGHATVTGTVGAPGGTASINAKGVSFQGVTYGDLTVIANADSQAATITSATLVRGGDRITGQGEFHYANQELENVKLEFRLSDLSFYANKFWPEHWDITKGKPRIGGSIAGKASIKGPLTMPSGTAAISLGQMSFEGTQFGNADIRLRSNGQKITVENFGLRQAKDRIDLTGAFDLNSQVLDGLKLDIAISDVGVYINKFFPQKQAMNASIHANLKASGPLLEPEGRVDMTLKEVQLSEVKISSAIFKLRSSGRRIHIDLAQVNTPLGEAKLAGNLLRGPADSDFDLKLTDLSLSGQKTQLALKKPGNIHFTRRGDLSLKDLSLGGPNGDIQLNGSLVSQKIAKFDIHISDFNSRGWFETLVTDRLGFSGLNARVNVIGAMQAPSITITGDLAQLNSSIDQLSLSGRFDLSYNNKGITIRQFQWQGGPGQQIRLAGTIPVNLLEKPLLRPGSISIDAQVSIPDLAAFNWIIPDYIPMDGDLQGTLQVKGSWAAPTGSFVIKSRGLNDPAHMKSIPPGPLDLDGNIRLDGKNLLVKTIQINSPKLTFAGRGEWTGMPALSELFQGKSAKPTGNVDLKGNLSMDDLSWLAAANPNLRRVAGRLQADLSMNGPILDPAIDAVVRLIDGELRPDADVPSLQALNLNAVVSPTGAQLETFTGELGGAPFQITGSVTRNSQSSVLADLRLQGDNLLFYRSAGLKLRADTDLTVKGPLKRLEVVGAVAITDGRLVKYFDFLSTLKGSSKPKTDLGLQLFSIQQAPFSDMVFDVQLTSKNPFAIRNNLARGALRPELKLTGTGKIPVLAGEIYLDPTRVSLPAGRLLFESGVIRFDPNRPDRPTLDLIGTSKMLGYDITMLVEGPFDEPVVTLSSVPPLSNDELLLLLIAGQQPNTENDVQAAQRQSMNVAVFLGKDLIARWFGSESAEASESIMERFDVSIGRAVTRSGEETIEAQFRIADGVIRDRDKLYLTGEKDVFDFYNAGIKIVFRFK
ncbi:MAG: translocation/assembly module TamB domain-containing protein [Desulfobacterales bacterium]|jgi:autotransporter translocation and assembly factor TamB